MSRDRREGEADHPPLGRGETLAPGYEILGHLHRSRNFDVYDVLSKERACRCVAKTPRRGLPGGENARRSLLREGELLAGLTHPHIVRLYEKIESPRPVLVLETLTGETLDHIVESARRRLPLREVVQLGLHLCSAVHYLHAKGVLHLDLKPSNIVSERGLAKILDLSIARPAGTPGSGAGTVQYMAPEQATAVPLGPAADVWGIGAVLFEAATGGPPFEAVETDEADPGEGPEDARGTHGNPDGREDPQHRADPVGAHRRVPAAFADLVDGCLEPDPILRPTVRALGKGLADLA